MSRRQDPIAIVPACLAAILLGISSARADEQSFEDLVRIVYLAEVVGYCSLADARVATGFRRARDRIVDSGGLEEEDIMRARAEGWKLAHAEWQNRGLGGFRNWCRTEGLEAAEGFRAIAADGE